MKVIELLLQPSLCLLLLLLLFVTTCVSATEFKPRPEYIGPRDRFWRHHVTKQSLIVDGVDHYHDIQTCLQESLSDTDRESLKERPTNRTIGKRIVDEPRINEERWGKVILVEIINAITPAHVKAVRALSSCVKQHIPKFHEVRPMYQEYNLPNDDDNLGGNTPTHLLPFLGIYLPQVVEEMFRTIRFGYDAAGWKALTIRDELLGQVDNIRFQSFPEPEELGFRASEHLSYDDFPLLDAHHDGLDTAYTVNFAFSGPEHYQGGYFYIIDDAGQKTFLKPQMYSCMILLGGNYLHGVTQITGGHREMFSNEMWYNPDLPLGTTLWTSNGNNMEEYILKCNQEEDKLAKEQGRPPQYGAHECKVGFSEFTSRGMSMDQIKNKYDNDGEHVDDYHHGAMNDSDEDYDEDDEDDDGGLDFSDDSDEEEDEEEEQHNRYFNGARGRGGRGGGAARRGPPKRGGGPPPKKHQMRRPIPPMDEDDFSFFAPPHNERYLSKKQQPNFLIPKKLQPGQIAPLYFRDTEERLQDEEAFVIGLPPKLLEEFTKYMDNNGMLKVAKKIAYETERGDKEHELYTLEDGKKWGIMHPKWGGNDMVWIDPGDEECFESLMDVLRKGDFDIVLDAIGDFFELDGLMIQGIGPIFISHFEHDPEYQQIHHDLIEAKGSFYNVIVPLHIPEDGAPLYVADDQRQETIQMTYNVGTLLGAGSRHGTGECDHRPNKDVRLSVAIYVADVNDANVEFVASDSTSLWPTQGDVHWFKAQEGRLWRHDDPSRSLKNDKGRQPIAVQDERKDCHDHSSDLCLSDPDGFRLECAKTCNVYLQDEEFYAQLETMVKNKSQTLTKVMTESQPSAEPTCNTPTCSEPVVVSEK